MPNLPKLESILLTRPMLAGSTDLDEDRYSALYYATQLLVYLRKKSNKYRLERYHCPGNRFISDASDLLRGPIESIFAGGIMPARTQVQHEAVFQPLITELRRLADQSPVYYTQLILARATVVTIDRTALADVAMAQFKRYYMDETVPGGVRPVQPNDPIPTCFGIFGKHQRQAPGASARKRSFGTDPRNLPVWRNPDRIPNAVLAPSQVKRFQVVLNFDYEKELRDVQLGSTIVATFHVTKTLENDISFTIDDDNHERFFHVRRRCGDDDQNPNPDKGEPVFQTQESFRTKLTGLMKRAVDEGAQLLVLPELLLDESDVAEIYNAWQQILADPKGKRRNARPQLMIPGSWHTRVETPRQSLNRSEVWGRQAPENGERGTGIDKVVPYAHRLGTAYRGTDEFKRLNDDNMVENLTPKDRPQVVLFCCENATMLVFICVDFLLDPLRDLARELYASLLVVPSMSQKMRIFRELMVGHVAATEAVIIYVNTIEPTDDDRMTVALVQHPDPTNVIAVDKSTVRNLPARRGAAVLDLDAAEEKDRVRWISM